MKGSVKNFFIYWFPILAYAGFIAFLSSLPGLATPSVAIFGFDKIIHIFEFGVFAFLLLRLLMHLEIRNPFLIAIVVTVIYGVLDEWHQSFVPGRMCSFWDILADTIGAVFVLKFKYIRWLKFLLR